MYRTVVKGALPVGYDVEMKKGIQRFLEMLRGVAGGIVFVTRYPRTDKSIRIMLGMWILATLLAVWSVTLYGWRGDFGSPILWLNAAVLLVDIYMVRNAILGLRYRRSRRGKVSRRSLP